MDIFGIDAKQVAGLVLLAGVTAMLIAVTTPNYTGLTSKVWDVPSDLDRLEIIARHPGAWRWSSAWWATGSILSLVGFGHMAVLFRQEGESLLGEVSVICFFLGVILWLVAMAYRMGVEPLVISSIGEGNMLPDWFKPVEAWSLNIMLMYMILAYTAIGVLGWGLLRTALLPSWIAWFALIFGVAGALSMTFSFPRLPGTEYSVFGLPILPHLLPLIMGVALLIKN